MQQALSTNSIYTHSGHCQKLESQITQLAAHIHAATFRLLELVREFDEIEGWAGPGMRSCAHWLNWKCGINLGSAREKVRVARALKDLPLISETFHRGEVSYSKVRAMTRVATQKNEDYLLMIARHGTAAHVERLVRQYRRVKRIEALERDNERHALRELDWYFDDDGSFVMKGRFTAEQGMLIKKTLESIMDGDFLEQKDVSADMLIRLFTENTQHGIRISPRTGACRWQGERMDDDLAVLGMLQLEQEEIRPVLNFSIRVSIAT